jgi:hypothetical protein
MSRERNENLSRHFFESADMGDYCRLLIIKQPKPIAPTSLQASRRVPITRLPSLASRGGAFHASGRSCTTTRQNAHSSELEIVYPWHPWFGRTVAIRRAVNRRVRTVLHVECEDGGRTRVLEVPRWMCDRATCVVMNLSDQPQVSCEHLRLLQELLVCTSMKELDGLEQRAKEDVIEKQRLDSSSKGDADAQGPSAPLQRSTQSVPTGIRETDLANASGRGNSASDAATGPVTARTSCKSPRTSKRKGGVR